MFVSANFMSAESANTAPHSDDNDLSSFSTRTYWAIEAVRSISAVNVGPCAGADVVANSVQMSELANITPEVAMFPEASASLAEALTGLLG
jgi:hypothetical protein